MPDLPASPGSHGHGIDRRVLRALQHITDATLAYLSEDELLQELLERVSDILDVDTVAFLLLEGDRLHARAAKGIEEEVEQGVRIPVGRGFAGRIAAERHAVFVPDVDHADILNPILREKGIRSLLGVPMLVEGNVIGVLHVGSLTPRDFNETDRELLQLAADRAAATIELARRLAAERAAREAAEAATRRLEALQRVTDATLAYLSEEALLQELLQRVSDILSVDTVAILLLEGDRLHARAAKGIEEEVEQGVRIPVGRGFAGRIAAERHAVFVPDVDHADILNPILREKGIRSLLGVPMLVEGNVIGVLHVGSLTPRDFNEADRELLQLAADRAAIAIEQARLYEQRRLADALQRRLLPQVELDTAGLSVASRYRPAAGGGVGGDWYDVFPLSGGRVGVAVGDVVGHGVDAAAVMAQLRTALRAYAIEGHAPAEVAERMSTLMWQLGPNSMTTLAYGVIDGAGETIELVNAGHPPPLLIDPDGAAEFLPVRGGVALGATTTAVYASDTFPLTTGTTVLMYTDGLVEIRGESIDVGLERLRSLATGFSDVDALCAAITERLVPEEPKDDIAFIAARVPPVTDRMTTRWPATPDILSSIRHVLRRWMHRLGASDDEIFDITVATQEACANAIEHAYAPGPAAFEVLLDHDAGRICITIRDRGRWREPRGENRGRGLPLMRTLMDDVDVQEAAGGTEVVLAKFLEVKV